MPTYHIPVTIDGVTVTADVLVDTDVVKTVTVTEVPDLTWTFTDQAGHFHAYNAKSELPTLAGVAVLNPATGLEEPRYYCTICRERVIPGVIQGPADVTSTVRRAWYIRATLTARPERHRVSVRAQPPGSPVVFGVATVDEVTGEGPYVVEFIGEGALARMKP